MLLPVAAFAHATPLSYEPAATAVVETAPTDIRIRFSERVEPVAADVVLFTPDGTRLTLEPTVAPDDPRLLIASFPAVGTGSFTVSWSVISADDGHYTKGAYAFAVGRESSAMTAGGTFQIQHRSELPEALSIALELIGEALLFALLLLPFLLRRTSFDAAEWKRLLRRTRLTLTVALLLTVIGVTWYVVYQTQGLQAERALPFTEALRIVLATASARAAIARAVFASLATVFLFLGFRSSTRKSWLIAAGILIVIVAVLRALISHAAASTFLPMLGVLVNAVHLLAKDLWIGGAIVFLIVLLPLCRRGTDAGRASTLLQRFDLAVAWCLAAGGVTGCFIVWLHLKDFGSVVTTEWGMRFLNLTLFAGLLLGARLYLHGPTATALSAMVRGEPDRDRIVQSSWIMLATEALVGVVVLVLSSLLIITTPPLRTATFSQTVTSQDATVRLASAPGDESELAVSLERSGDAISEAVVTIANTEEGIGPIVVSTQRRADAIVAFPVSALTPPGSWTVDVTLRRPRGYDAVGSFSISVPNDLRSSRGHSPSLGMASILLAVLLLGGAWVLHRRAKTLLPPDNRTPSPLPFDLPPSASWFYALPVAAVAGTSLLLLNHGHGGFATVCANNGDLWHDSAPMRAGRVTSAQARLGCTVGSGRGQYHFTDMREYLYYRRPVNVRLAVDAPSTAAVGSPVPIRLRVLDVAGKPVTDLTPDEEHLMHAVIVRSDLTTYDHVHPVQTGTGAFALDYVFTKPGEYLLAFNAFQRSQPAAATVRVRVADAPVVPDAAALAESRVWTDGRDTVTLRAPVTMPAGIGVTVGFSVASGATAARDLEPYSGVAMHIVTVREDLQHFRQVQAVPPPTFWERLRLSHSRLHHSQGVLPSSFGPRTQATIALPFEGTYVLFAQYQRNGQVKTARFVLKAVEAAD